MKVLVSGSSGTVGTHLCAHLRSRSFEVWRLVRSRTEGENRIFWDPEGRGVDDPDMLEGFAAAVCLSGENIAGRWTERKKKLITDSRINTARSLVDVFSGLRKPPAVFVCASAVGYYGDRGEEELTEDSAAGSGFFPDLCARWEGEANRASDFGTRVVNLRIGIVLSPEGGMLGSLLPLFRMGLGGVVGDGGQYLSWISIEDLSRIVVHLLERGETSGPVNAVAAGPVTNREFTAALASVLGRPAFFPVPAFAVRVLFGEMGRSTVLASARVFPKKLLSGGYEFFHAELSGVLSDVISG